MRRQIDDVFCGHIVTTTDSNGNVQQSESDSRHGHLLRCDYDTVSRSSNIDHEDDFAVECGELFCPYSHSDKPFCM